MKKEQLLTLISIHALTKSATAKSPYFLEAKQ